MRLGVAERLFELADLHFLVVDLRVLLAHGRVRRVRRLAHLQCVVHASAAVCVPASGVISVQYTRQRPPIRLRPYIRGVIVCVRRLAHLHHQPSEWEQNAVFVTPGLHCGSPVSGGLLHKSKQLEKASCSHSVCASGATVCGTSPCPCRASIYSVRPGREQCVLHTSASVSVRLFHCTCQQCAVGE